LYKISISKYQIEAILGILDFERINTQKIEIDFKCSYKNKDEYIDYMKIASFIKEALIGNKYMLIEDAIDDICENIKIKYKNMKDVFLEIKKLNVLESGYVSVSSK
jgi:dihydroneopterin aldolase